MPLNLVHQCFEYCPAFFSLRVPPEFRIFLSKIDTAVSINEIKGLCSYERVVFTPGITHSGILGLISAKKSPQRLT